MFDDFLEEECIICFEVLDKKNQLNRFRDCDHYNLMHPQCIDILLTSSNNVCPLCRKNITIVKIDNNNCYYYYLICIIICVILGIIFYIIFYI